MSNDEVVKFSTDLCVSDLWSLVYEVQAEAKGVLRVIGRLDHTPASDIEWPDNVEMVAIDLETGLFTVRVIGVPLLRDDQLTSMGQHLKYRYRGADEGEKPASKPGLML